MVRPDSRGRTVPSTACHAETLHDRAAAPRAFGCVLDERGIAERIDAFAQFVEREPTHVAWS